MRQCEICHKGYRKVVKRKKLRGKFNPVNTYFQKSNLQYLKIDPKGNNNKSHFRLLVCKDCRKKVLRGEIKI